MQKWQPKGVLLGQNLVVNLAVPPIARLHGSVNAPLEPSLQDASTKQRKTGNRDAMQAQVICDYLLRAFPKGKLYKVGRCTERPAKNYNVFLELNSTDCIFYSLTAKVYENFYTYPKIKHASAEFHAQIYLFQGEHGEHLLQRFMILYGYRLLLRRNTSQLSVPDNTAYAFGHIEADVGNETDSEASWEYV